MKLWLDHQLSPHLCGWLEEHFDLDVTHVRELSLYTAEDPEVFEAAREAAAVVMTKDRDFLNLVQRLGSPPQVLWITCGNTSNTALKTLFEATLHEALQLLKSGERLVEISDANRPPKALL